MPWEPDDERRVRLFLVVAVILGVVLPVLWAFGIDLALPLALAAMVAGSPFAVKIAFKENGATPTAWWGQLPARVRQTITEHPGWRGRLTMVAEAPAAALALVWFGIGTLLLLGWRRLRGG